MSSNQPRQTWSNRLTYILTVAGATVGFGATWRFPYLVGENGGGAYVFLFCIAMFVIGIPMILVENVIGRRKGVNALDAFGGSMNGKPVAKIWKLVGWMGLLGAFGIMAYYMVLGGWVISYIVNIISGKPEYFQPCQRRNNEKLLYRTHRKQPLGNCVLHFLVCRCEPMDFGQRCHRRH